MAWKVTINFTDGSSSDLSDLFDSEEDANDAADECCDNWECGKETLMLAGEDYDDRTILSCEVWEE